MIQRIICKIQNVSVKINQNIEKKEKNINKITRNELETKLMFFFERRISGGV